MKAQLKLYFQHEPVAFAVGMAMLIGAIANSVVAFVAVFLLVLFFAKIFSGPRL